MVALAVAEAVGGEVVNADAFQLYRGMDIGTAKVPLDQRHGIAHHLVDVLDVTEELSVALFQRRGRAVLADLAGRGVPAIVVGGSWLYVRALLDDLRFPGSDPRVRARWEQQLDALGPLRLHEVLAERDPEAARQILPTNGRRIVRALEVGELTGQPFAAELPRSGPPLIDHNSFGVDLAPEILDAGIEQRVAAMFDAGLVEEVSALLDRGLREAPTARRALGYPQVLDLIDGALTPGRRGPPSWQPPADWPAGSAAGSAGTRARYGSSRLRGRNPQLRRSWLACPGLPVPLAHESRRYPVQQGPWDRQRLHHPVRSRRRRAGV